MEGKLYLGINSFPERQNQELNIVWKLLNLGKVIELHIVIFIYQYSLINENDKNR